MALSLADKQKVFSTLVARLILHTVGTAGVSVTLGEAWRTKEQAELYAKEGNGIVNSLHCLRLAIDLNLFRDGKLLVTTDDYRSMGEFWESLSTADYSCSWGGRFGDADHFAIAHQGVR
jgi:hypothetical protein